MVNLTVNDDIGLFDDGLSLSTASTTAVDGLVLLEYNCDDEREVGG